ncbi:MAG: hypothetical protein PWP53_3259 [Lacrimispora sp.]|jgi:hypothetical protein|nr:hypothetical protein [Lacrimispora sp.]
MANLLALPICVGSILSEYHRILAAVLTIHVKGLSETKQAVRSKKVDVVLVKNVSCIGRNTFKNIIYIEEINVLGRFLLPTSGVINIVFTEQVISNLAYSKRTFLINIF